MRGIEECGQQKDRDYHLKQKLQTRRIHLRLCPRIYPRRRWRFAGTRDGAINCARRLDASVFAVM